jgi:hypothetical protein
MSKKEKAVLPDQESNGALQQTEPVVVFGGQGFSLSAILSGEEQAMESLDKWLDKKVKSLDASEKRRSKKGRRI